MATDDRTDDGKKPIPTDMIPFVGFATATPDQLLFIEENGNGVHSSLVRQNSLDGMNEKNDDSAYQKDMALRRSLMERIITCIASEVVPFLRSVVAAAYDNISSTASRFYYCFKCAPAALKDKWHTLDAQMDSLTAKARQAPDADNFLQLQRLHMQKMSVATEIIMNEAGRKGKTADYNAAVGDHAQLADFDEKLSDLQSQLAGKSEDEKDEILQQAFPDLWEQYKQGHLTQAQMGVSTAPGAAHDPEGIAEPFLKTLKDLFASASRALFNTSSNDWTQPIGQKTRPQPLPG